MTHDARSWATALSLEDGDDVTLEARASALEAIGLVLSSGDRSSRDAVSQFFDDPRIHDDSKVDALSTLIPGDERWAAFATLVVRRKSASLLPAIAAAYRANLDERSGIERITIESARPLSADDKASVIDAWMAARRVARPKLTRVVAAEASAPELLGGFRLKSGSIRYDASVAGRLKRLEADLARPLDRPAIGSGGLS